MAKKGSTKNKKSESPLFVFLDEISYKQTPGYFDSLSPLDKKEYKTSRYMIHRFLSMNPHYIPVVNILQRYTDIPDKAHYLFLIGVLPKQKQFFRYIKGTSRPKYPEWLISIMKEHYKVSNKESTEYIDILLKHDIEELRTLCKMYGIEDTQIEKALK